MSIIEALLYGIIQGAAEFLPISSSGHLALAQSIFGAKNIETDYFMFNVLLHLATLVAVAIVYYRDLWNVIKAFFSLVGKLFSGRLKKEPLTASEKLTFNLILATVPLAVGALISDKVEALSGMPKVIGALLILNGCMLWLSDRIKASGAVELRPLQALAVGLIQLVGVLPGISRSGSTITGGRLFGLDRQEAVRFSFLLSVPAILGANILSLRDIAENPVETELLLPFAVGAAAAILVGIAAIKLLQLVANKHKFGIFAVYCAAVGAAALIFA